MNTHNNNTTPKENTLKEISKAFLVGFLLIGGIMLGAALCTGELVVTFI